ncbi:phage tail protein I [Zooshikella ganghwensis]|uniref:phage tail protein I n=1 Tax=Zooshikella ganghwensis TaxID=202772 RepID=UPI0004151174|nr:phage tail protein I [Zooshikella ganghwensis]
MSLLPSNASPFERALEGSCARVSVIPARPDIIWKPDVCPELLLPWLAWALSVDEWDENWTSDIKRQVIKSSIETHLIKGTRKSIRLVLDALGYESDIRAWYELDPVGEPYHFEVMAWRRRGVPASKDTIKRMEKLIHQVKSLRDHFQLSLTLNLDTRFYVSGIQQRGLQTSDQTYQSAILQAPRLQQSLNTASVGYQVNTHSHDTLTNQLPHQALTVKPVLAAACRGYHINDLTMGVQLP